MDNSTLVFIIALALIFFLLRWFISPIPQSVPEEFNVSDPARQSPNSVSSRIQRRQVTPSMIEVVQAIGPHLSESQIRRSLESTGSVEATIEALIEPGNSPSAASQFSSASGPEIAQKSAKPAKSLLEKYDVGFDENGMISHEGKWGVDENERTSILRKRKAEMILKARKNVGGLTSESL